MHPICKRLYNPLTTPRTFNTGSSGVFAHCHLAAFDRYCLEDMEEAAPGGIQSRLCQSGSCQPLDVQVLKGNQVIRSTKPMCNLIVKVFALSGDVQMQPRYFVCLFLVIVRVLLHPRQLALRLC